MLVAGAAGIRRAARGAGAFQRQSQGLPQPCHRKLREREGTVHADEASRASGRGNTVPGPGHDLRVVRVSMRRVGGGDGAGRDGWPAAMGVSRALAAVLNQDVQRGTDADHPGQGDAHRQEACNQWMETVRHSTRSRFYGTTESITRPPVSWMQEKRKRSQGHQLGATATGVSPSRRARTDAGIRTHPEGDPPGRERSRAAAPPRRQGRRQGRRRDGARTGNEGGWR